MIDVRRLYVLREIAARGSFSAAAEALSFTQSAISQQIAALEREVGALLVERGTRGGRRVRLTPSGQALLRHAEGILARVTDAEKELAAIAGLRGGHLRLASFESAGSTLVPQAVALFHARYPEVDLGLRQAEPQAATDLLRAGDLDLALVYDCEEIPGMLDPDLELTHLVDDSYQVVLPEGHPLTERGRLELADVASEPWINSTPRSDCHRILHHVAKVAGFEPQVAFEIDEIAASLALVGAGVGVTLLPSLGLTNVPDGVVVRSLSRHVPIRRIWIARLVDSYHSPASAAMSEILREVALQFAATEQGEAAAVGPPTQPYTAPGDVPAL